MKKLSLLMVLLSMALVGCHFSSKKKPTQVLKVSFQHDPPTLDPRKGGDHTSSTVQFMLFEGLTRITKNSTTELALAKKINISDDQKVYTFHLKNTFWTDGHPVTAYDFEMAWKNMLDPHFPCPNANLLYPIKNAKAAKEGKLPLESVGLRSINAQTFEVTLEGPTPYFLELTSFCVFCPVPHHIVKNHPDWADKMGPHLVTNGPFSLKVWKPQDKMILEKNPNYWESNLVFLEEIQVSFIDNEMTVLGLYENKKIDFLGLPFSPIPLDCIDSLKKEIQTNSLGATSYCSFNVNDPIFKNQNIRKAFAYAINRKAIIQHITGLNETIATSPVPPILKFQNNPIFFEDNDQEKARFHFQKGLEELGLKPKDLNGVTMMYLAAEVPSKIAQALQQQWLDTLNINVNIECYTLKVYLDKLVHRDFQFAYTQFVIQYSDIMNILDLYKFKNNPKNYPGWENKNFIQVLNDSMQIKNPQKRIRYLKKAETLLIEEMPIAPIYHWNQIYLKHPYVKGIHISPIGSIHLGKAYLDNKNYD